MTVICLEGASAVGKTTSCEHLVANFGFQRIPEVNELFERPAKAEPDWYLQRQVERWQMAEKISAAGGSAVLDGDVFQPLWYNWIFSDLGLQPIDDVIGFYRKVIENGEIRFPDKYFLLTAPEVQLRVRKLKDKSRSRRNFEKHLRLIRPQMEYFCQMDLVSVGRVLQLDTDKSAVLSDSILSCLLESDVDEDHRALFEALCQFISRPDC